MKAATRAMPWAIALLMSGCIHAQDAARTAPSVREAGHGEDTSRPMRKQDYIQCLLRMEESLSQRIAGERATAGAEKADDDAKQCIARSRRELSDPGQAALFERALGFYDTGMATGSEDASMRFSRAALEFSWALD
ncbi:hypothetical protein [Luteimonas aquatica]|uniref:hypothetical protein n=1 Tax=Luteimonas aquatica TaxID=450364 RepID=UPI001F5768D4|nr:hypothetical protein [Luteimonas aquatica]